ncbi:hypothetical protein K4L06_17935 [Lysobacter sp. BMK333-48F3]|uniref:alpha/beta hydrolase family protein n=1 Tax=Lysobacter sp. BMK333-48F3 TaxID=2867962 RepID=UPI001C8B7972|nr:hypothetical protein [Lysobacter sp. BMK333-48F3]MBX9403194.1 hypothetical protein [Lysobacter sp. BMK333-48F3]
MSYPDLAILALALGAAWLAALSSRPGPRGLAAVAALSGLGMAVQAWRLGPCWQYAPLCALVLALAALAWLRRRPSPRHRALVWTGRGGLLALAAAAALPWALLPVPELPPPRGPYPVGSRVFRWVDPQRLEAATADPRDRRNLVVQAWYPAAAGGAVPPPYLDGLGRLPETVSFIPSLAMARYGRIDTHARGQAPPLASTRPWPVVLFSPGYGASRGFYSGLLADLASRGFVVLALDHPYEVSVTQLADGRLATPIERLPPDDPGQLHYMAMRMEVRAEDLRGVLDRVQRGDGFGALSARMDRTRVAAIGHSFGGAAAIAAAMADPRLRAAANLDGTLYGRALRQRLEVPLLLLESDRRETGHSERYLQGTAALIRHLRAGGYRYQIAAANHYSFTDVPLFLAPPARWLLGRLVGGSRGAAATQALSNDLLTAFLHDAWRDAPGDVAAAAAHHSGLSGGALSPAAAAGAK